MFQICTVGFICHSLLQRCRYAKLLIDPIEGNTNAKSNYGRRNEGHKDNRLGAKDQSDYNVCDDN